MDVRTVLTSVVHTEPGQDPAIPEVPGDGLADRCVSSLLGEWFPLD